MPLSLWAQPKAEWTFYGPKFMYEKGALVPKALNITGINDVVFTKDGALVVSSVENPIVFFKDGKDYSTQGILFTKEKSKVSFMKGGETKDALSMLIDQKNNLWFGTSKGLNRIDYAIYADLEKMKEAPSTDGVRISDETPGMPFGTVTIIREGSNGHLWVTGMKMINPVKSEYKGISEFNGTEWKNYSITGAEGKEVSKMILDAQDAPIVVTSISLLGNAVSWYKDGQWKSLGEVAKNEAVTALAVDKQNTLYVGTNVGGLFAWKNESWVKQDIQLGVGDVTDIKFDQGGNLWIAHSGGVKTVNAQGGGYSITQENSPLPTNTVKKIIIDGENRKWFITDLGMVGYKEPAFPTDEAMKVFTKFNSGMVDGAIGQIINYKDGFLMVNNDRGLIRYDGKSFSVLTPGNQQEVAYYGAATDKSGNAYMGTYRYLHKYDGTNYTKWDWKDDIGKQVNTVLVDSKNTVWIGFNGVSKFNGTTWQNFDKKNAGLSSNTVLQLFEDSKGNIWAILPDGVAKYDGTTWTSFTKKTTEVQLRNMIGVVETKEGKLLFTNGYTLAEYDGTSMKALATLKDVGDVQNMILDEDGTLLMATKDKGIAKYKDGVISFCDQKTCKLPSNAINYIYKHTDGTYWISCGSKPATVNTMPQAGQTAPTESATDAFTRKVKEFDTFFGLIQLNKL